MRWGLLLLVPLLLAGCDEKQALADAKLIKAARKGMNTVRGLPGGRTATFTEVRLVGDDTVCGMIDGNDGDGPRPFATRGDDPVVADRHDPAASAQIAKMCAGKPVREITSRNQQFTDLEVAR